MFRFITPAFAPLLALFLFLAARGAHAQVQTWTPAPLYVLTLQTDDADDEADGLTHALRAHVRTMPRWALGETPQSFETLSIALRCPRLPDAACLQRIGDQLRAEHYIWGTLARGQRGEVSVELHLWRRGDAEWVASASYSDALKDANDPRVRAIAKSLLEKLTEPHITGALVVQAGSQQGDVIVDDVIRGSLKGGTARVVVSEGTHTIELRGPAGRTPSRTVMSVGGSDVTVDFSQPPEKETPTAFEGPRSPSYLRPILAYSAIGVGTTLLVLAGVEGLNWQRDKDASEQDRRNVPNTVTDVCATPVSAAAQDACDKGHDAKTVSTLGWVFAAAGALLAATGVWVLATPTRIEGVREPPSAAHASIDLLPRVSPHEQSLDVRVRF